MMKRSWMTDFILKHTVWLTPLHLYVYKKRLEKFNEEFDIIKKEFHELFNKVHNSEFKKNHIKLREKLKTF